MTAMLYSNKTWIFIGIFCLLLTLLLIFMLLPQSPEPTYSPFKGDATDQETMKILNQEKADMEDLRLIRIIGEHFIEPPSISPYHLDYPDKLDFSNGQAPFVDSRLGFMEGGFYIECGALNGEKGSNSLYFERHRKWNGLLIEADPSNYAALKTKNRKAFTMNACLNPYTYPAKLRFNKAFNLGRVIHDTSVQNWLKEWQIKENVVEIQCFPLYSILLALNQTTVDFFSLDVEGDELRVLQTIPFDKINIKMLTVEYINQPGTVGELNQFMIEKGYEPQIRMHKDDGTVTDVIYKKKNS